jgi:hypothetical protein
MLSQAALERKCAERYAKSMPLGGTSPLLAANAAKYPVGGTAYPDPGTPTVDAQCVLGMLVDVLAEAEAAGAGSCYRDSDLWAIADASMVDPVKLSPPVTRLSGYVKLSDLRNIGELSASVSTYQDAVALYNRAISSAVLAASDADTTIEAVKGFALGSFSSQGASDESLQELTDALEAYQPSATCSTGGVIRAVESSTDVVAAGGAGSLVDTESVGYATSNQVVEVGWGGFRSKPSSFNTYVTLVDRTGASVNIQKADDTVIIGLALNLSPETLTINAVNVVNRYQTLTSWVEEHWGEDLDQVSFSGKSMGLITEKNGVKYLATDTRVDSPAYQEMKSLVDLYQTNGIVLQGASVGDVNRPARNFYTPNSLESVRRILSHPRTGLIQERLYVSITFDFMQCIGYFESFELVEDAETPFLFNYSVNFKSEMTTYG